MWGDGISVTANDVIISSNTAIDNNQFGILLSNSHNCTIWKNTASNNLRGLELMSSINNTIDSNIFTNNRESGMSLGYSSNNNSVVNNIAIDNQEDRVYI